MGTKLVKSNLNAEMQNLNRKVNVSQVNKTHLQNKWIMLNRTIKQNY